MRSIVLATMSERMSTSSSKARPGERIARSRSARWIVAASTIGSTGFCR